MELNPTTNPVKRMIAAFADFTIACFFYLALKLLLPNTVAALAAICFFLFRDAIAISDLKGASPGKRLVGLKAIRRDGRICDLKTSAKRNIPLLIGPLLFLPLSFTIVVIPILGWMTRYGALLLGLAVVAVECLEIWSGHRIRVGDQLAGTLVVEIEAESSAEASP